MAAAPVSSRALIGIDWGTTNRRGYVLAADGTCSAEHTDADGMLAARGRFAESLDVMLAALVVADPGTPVLMSGMVGSASGWIEAPYLDLQVPLLDLRERLIRVPGTTRPCLIVPGYCQRGAATDVMRGEETQLLGAVMQGHRDGWFVLPGTHCKWVHLRAGVITEFATYMTGELFALLGQHGTLAAASGGVAQVHASASPEAFAGGLVAQPEAALSNALFGCRARVVSGAMPAAHAHPFLSGLLIGAEWHDVRRRNGGALPARVTLIGSPALAEHYAVAGAAFGVHVEVLDPRVTYLAALAALQPQ